jgi:hypothetical protein
LRRYVLKATRARKEEGAGDRSGEVAPFTVRLCAIGKNLHIG